MSITEERFFETLRPSLIHKLLRRSLMPFRGDECPQNSEREQFLQSLYADIRSRRYAPTVPRGYIVSNKGNYVPRISPVFSYRDMCVYYFCITQLQDELAVNRVPGTFGGWQIGNPMRENENLEQSESDGPYSLRYSLNPYRWMKHWQEFQRLAFEKSRQGEFRAFIKFDIANFYDTVSLELLERKIRGQCDALHSSVIDLLFIVLRRWNRQYQGHSDKTIGIPQEEKSDCSRILANFYLQEYDASMAFVCRERNRRAEYMRYADDQIIMAESLEDARQILVDAARNLHSIGLNINASKVEEFPSRDDFDYYWAFQLMDLLGDESDTTSIDEGAQQLNSQRREDSLSVSVKPWRWWSVERRLLKIGLARVTEPTRTEIATRFMDPSSVEKMDDFMLSAVARGLTEDERVEFFRIIDECVPRVPFNSFHLNLRRFFSRYDRPWRDIGEIDARIDELNEIWNPC